MNAKCFQISQGGFIDDFLSHVMCCCCALVQELREVEIRGAYGINYIQLTYQYLISILQHRTMIVS